MSSVPEAIVAIANRHISTSVRDNVPFLKKAHLPTVMSLVVLGAKIQGDTIEDYGASTLTGRLGLVKSQASVNFNWKRILALFPDHYIPLREFAEGGSLSTHVALLVTIQTDSATHRTVVGVPLRRQKTGIHAQNNKSNPGILVENVSYAG